MATPTPQPTRQQLDDLDALLQRMLALPVDPAEEPPESAAASPFSEPLAPPAGNVVLADAPPPLSPPAMPRLSQRPPAAAGPVPLPLLNPVPPAERRAPVLPPPDRPVSPRAALAASRPPGPPLLLRPLLGLNRLFDSVALGLGAPGRWLRRPAGRALLGLIGLFLLVAAMTFLLLDRIGWTW